MECPACHCKEISIDLHSDGYAEPLLECIECGNLWIASFEEAIAYRKVA